MAESLIRTVEVICVAGPNFLRGIVLVPIVLFDEIGVAHAGIRERKIY